MQLLMVSVRSRRCASSTDGGGCRSDAKLPEVFSHARTSVRQCGQRRRLAIEGAGGQKQHQSPV